MPNQRALNNQPKGDQTDDDAEIDALFDWASEVFLENQVKVTLQGKQIVSVSDGEKTVDLKGRSPT